MLGIFQALNKIFGLYALLLVIFGTIANILSCIICAKLSRNTTFVFLAFLTITDVFTLYYWNLNNFLKEFLDIDLLTRSIWSCKIGNFVQFTSLQISAWILVKKILGIFFLKFGNSKKKFKVLISIERFLSVHIKHWKEVYFKPKQALILILGLISTLIVLNLNIIITFGYEKRISFNKTILFCFEVEGYPSTFWMDTWGKVFKFFFQIFNKIFLFF